LETVEVAQVFPSGGRTPRLQQQSCGGKRMRLCFGRGLSAVWLIDGRAKGFNTGGTGEHRVDPDIETYWLVGTIVTIAKARLGYRIGGQCGG
jgi:hypothetical protein